MKPEEQASNLKLTDISSTTATIEWENGDGDFRIVTIAPEVEKGSDGGATESNTSDNTFLNPDICSQRQFFPGKYLRQLKCPQKEESDKNILSDAEFIAPKESLPIDGTCYNANMVFGLGDELKGTERVEFGSPVQEDIIITGEETDTHVVYSGTGSSVTILGLIPSTGYYVSVFEANKPICKYNHESNRSKIITNYKKSMGSIDFTIRDCRTQRAVVAMIYIRDIMGNLRFVGSSDLNGSCQTDLLELGGYTVEIVADNYHRTFLRNVYIKEKPDVEVSKLHLMRIDAALNRIPIFHKRPDTVRILDYTIEMQRC